MNMEPDWVMLGVPTPEGGVAVYASKDLTKAELRYEASYQERTGICVAPEKGPHRIDLTVGMKTYTVVVADTYEQAFRGLFDAWSPEPDRQAIAAQQRAIHQ